jgi:cytochrome c-type biogenesis protein CcmH/NrfG
MKVTRRLGASFACLALLGGLAAWAWQSRQAAPAPRDERAAHPPEDPRLATDVAFRNVRPEVRYVGDVACAGCHEGLGRSFHQHPMGRSAAAVRDATPLERFDVAARNPFEDSAFRYRVERREGHWFQQETVPASDGRIAQEAEVHFAVGAGAQGRSYLINRDGFLFQAPASWYPRKQRWDLSPGYEDWNWHFARPALSDCLFCHTNYVRPVEGTVNRYELPLFPYGPAIGCERCHGPGELHVGRQQRGEAYAGRDDTVVNPARLEPALREAVCQQCHLQGSLRVERRGRRPFDYRPGLPLHSFLSVFVKPPSIADPRFVGHVEQMHQSRCFRASDGRLGCTSCHDPHRQPAPPEKAAYYRAGCLKCHRESGCGESPEVRRRQAPGDHCAACHMPALHTEVRHTAVTDHRIPRRPEGASPAAGRLGPGELPLVNFHRGLLEPGDPEAARDQGVALMERADRLPPGPREALSRWALPVLESALDRDASDVPAREALAQALWGLGRQEAAAAALERTLARAPDREPTLHLAATLALERRRPDEAIAYWRRAAGVNPWRGDCWYGIAAAQLQRRDWDRAVEAARQALRLEPAHVEARTILVRGLAERGDREQARREFELLMDLKPADADALRRWAAERLR